jgi:hypothetical protein
VELYLHSPIRLHSVVLKLSTGTNLRFYVCVCIYIYIYAYMYVKILVYRKHITYILLP